MRTLQTICGERRTYSNISHSHRHSFAQLILPLQGTLIIETPKQKAEVDDSLVFFIPPGCQHRFYACDTNEFLTLDIPASFVDDWRFEDCSQGRLATFEVRWRALRTLLLADIDAARPPADSLLYLVPYMRNLLTVQSPPRSLQYLHQHYHQPTSIAQLAQLEGYTPSYYSEWFKQQTGQTPQAYLHDLRLRAAKRLLQETELPIFQIAQEVGFAQSSSLIRLFRQRDRLTPQQYRSQIRSAAN